MQHLFVFSGKKMLSQTREEFTFSFYSEIVRANSITWNYYNDFQIEFFISSSEIRYNNFFNLLLRTKFVITISEIRYNNF